VEPFQDVVTQVQHRAREVARESNAYLSKKRQICSGLMPSLITESKYAINKFYLHNLESWHVSQMMVGAVVGVGTGELNSYEAMEDDLFVYEYTSTR